MKYFFSALLTAATLSACDDGPSEIGSDFFQNGSLDVIYIDSLTLKVSTVQYDSIVTNDASRLLVGYHEDMDIGKLKASAFFQIAPDAALVLDENSTTYSRTEMVLVPDGYSLYDTTQHITIRAHEVLQEIESDGEYLFNTSSFTYDENPIGSLTFLPRPNKRDTLEIPLADAFGNKIFLLAQNEEEEVSGIASFIDEFKGIALFADSASSGAVMGFHTTPEIRIYYWDTSKTPSEEKYLSIKGGTYLKFNQILSDRRGTDLHALITQRSPVPSDLTDNLSFIQGSSGLALRVEIPYLKDILLQNRNLTITDAVLQLPPVIRDKNTPLPEKLAISIVDFKNDLYTSLENTARLIEDEYLGRDTYYEADVRSFIKGQLLTEEFNRNALLFSLEEESYRASMDILKMGDQQGAKKMTLKIYCVVIKNQE